MHVFPDDKGLMVDDCMVPDSVASQDVVLDSQSLQRELEVLKSKVTNINKITDLASSKIRSVIKEDMKPTPWPYPPFDVHVHV